MAGEYKIHINGDVHSEHDDHPSAHEVIMQLIESGQIKMGQAYLQIPTPPGYVPPTEEVIIPTANT
jgi:hypothetical protein